MNFKKIFLDLSRWSSFPPLVLSQHLKSLPMKIIFILYFTISITVLAIILIKNNNENYKVLTSRINYRETINDSFPTVEVCFDENFFNSYANGSWPKDCSNIMRPASLGGFDQVQFYSFRDMKAKISFNYVTECFKDLYNRTYEEAVFEYPFIQPNIIYCIYGGRACNDTFSINYVLRPLGLICTIFEIKKEVNRRIVNYGAEYGLKLYMISSDSNITYRQPFGYRQINGLSVSLSHPNCSSRIELTKFTVSGANKVNIPISLEKILNLKESSNCLQNASEASNSPSQKGIYTQEEVVVSCLKHKQSELCPSDPKYDPSLSSNIDYAAPITDDNTVCSTNLLTPYFYSKDKMDINKDCNLATPCTTFSYKGTPNIMSLGETSFFVNRSKIFVNIYNRVNVKHILYDIEFNIFFKRPTAYVVKEITTIKSVNMFSDMSNLVSLFFGFSVVHICEFIIPIFIFFWYLIRRVFKRIFCF
uniref:Transmembrane protein n=1 Tax=Parastrongyloides trichosuri TaxID=131310 RepID=A0A0N4ZI37_PARTI